MTRTRWPSFLWRPSSVLVVLCCSYGLWFGVSLAGSQARVRTTITSDNTLRTTVTPQGPVHTIAGGTRRGANLFHSFDRFSVGTGDTATFVGPGDVRNILNRVTGGQPSEIDGRIRSEIPGANFFFLNPHGVLFGPNATLDVSGAFHVSTANELRLGDGATFVARPEGPQGLTSAPPVAFGFLQARPEAIRIQGSTLQVADGQALSVVGGPVTMQGGQVLAPQGQIQLVSSGAVGTVPLTPTAALGPLPGGSITLESGARVHASGERGGSVHLLAAQTRINASSVRAETAGGGDAGTVVVRGDTVLLIDEGILSTSALVGSRGNAGRVTVVASDRVMLTGQAGNRSRITSGTSGAGQGGLVEITTGKLTLQGEARLNTSADQPRAGSAGQILVTAAAMRVEDGARIASTSEGLGTAGRVMLQVGQLTVANGGQISVGASQPDGAASARGGGELVVNASGPILIDGGSISLPDTTGLFARSIGSVEQPGRIILTAPTLTLTTFGTLTARGSDPGLSHAGQIVLDVGRLTLTNGAQISSSTAAESSGTAGTITIQATEAITLGSTTPAAAQIVSQAEGGGRGGQITIQTPRLEVTRGGRISALALGGGAAGRIDLTQVRTLVLSGGVIDAPPMSEVVLDGSLGAPLTLTGSEIVIDATLGQVREANLFHSFRRFQLLPDSQLTFTGPAGITTILSRITGDEAALLNGTVRTTIPGAHLFFVAPRGLLIGPTGRLEGFGALHASTAAFLRLADGGRFDSRGSDARGLTAGTPVALGFTDATLAPIDLQPAQTPNTPFAPPGITLSLVGGDMTVSGGGELWVPRGHLHLVSVAAPGEVLLGPAGLDPMGFARFGRLRVDGATVSTATDTTAPAGTITIDTGRLELIAGAHLSANTLGTTVAEEANAGRILIAARDSILLSGRGRGSASRITSTNEGPGNGGIVELSTGVLEVVDNGRITASADSDNPQSNGSAGEIHIAADTMRVADGGRVNSRGVTRSGQITIAVHELTIASSGQISVSGRARPDGGPGGQGVLTISATDRVLIDGQGNADTGLFGETLGSDTRPARLSVSAPTVEIRNRGRISTNTVAAGDAGQIDVQATELTVSGRESGIFTIASNSGNSGTIVIQAARLRVDDAGEISTSTEQGSRGNAGQVTITASDSVILTGRTTDNPSRIASNTDGQGRAGTVEIHTRRLHLQEGGDIATNAGRESIGAAGSVRIHATESVTLEADTISSRIRSSTVGIGDAGAVEIHTPRLQMNGSATRILTSTAFERGHAGQILLVADILTVENGARIASATNGAGNAGRIDLQVGQLMVEDGSRIAVTADQSNDLGAPVPTGAGGLLTVTARERIRIDGQNNTSRGTGLFGGNQGSSEVGGRIRVSAPLLEIVNIGQIGTTTDGTGNAGQIDVAVERLTLSNGGVLSVAARQRPPDAQNPSPPAPSGSAGRLTVMAREQIHIDGQNSPDRLTGLFGSNAGSGRDGGQISVDTPRLDLVAGGAISTAALQDGPAGRIELMGGEFRMAGSNSTITSTTEGHGNAGRIVLQGRQVLLTEGASISTSSLGQFPRAGNAGQITITAQDTLQSTGGSVTTAAHTGQGGTITMAAERAIHLEGTTISASVTGGRERGGDIVVQTPMLTLAGSRLEAETQGAGAAGSITLQAATLHAQATTLSSSSTAQATGNAGTVRIQEARTVTLTQSDLRTSAAGTGAGGAIMVAASEAVILEDSILSATVHNAPAGANVPRGDLTIQTPELTLRRATLAAETTGSGQAGGITLAARVLTAQDSTLTSSSTGQAAGDAGTIILEEADTITLIRSRVATEATVADGGDIQVRATTAVRLQDSAITTAVRSGEGQGGNITVDSDLVILERSRIVADAFGGPGGNITIIAGGLVADSFSQISASSEQSVDGTVDIQALTNLSGVVAPLAQDFVPAVALLMEHCAGRRSEARGGSLISLGRDSLPPEPGSPLASGGVGQRRPGESSRSSHIVASGEPHWSRSFDGGRQPAWGTGLDPCARGQGKRQP